MFKVPPSWIIKPRDQELNQGSKSYVHCMAGGSPPPRIKWLIKGLCHNVTIVSLLQSFPSAGSNQDFQSTTSISGVDTLANGPLTIDTTRITTNSTLIEAKCVAESSPDQVIEKQIRIKITGKLANSSFAVKSVNQAPLSFNPKFAEVFLV